MFTRITSHPAKGVKRPAPSAVNVLEHIHLAQVSTQHQRGQACMVAHLNSSSSSSTPAAATQQQQH